MRSQYSWYQNLKFRNKILILCFTLSLIPVIILGIFCTVQSRKQLVSHEKVYISNILEQTNSTLNHYLSLQESIITTLAWDEAIQQAVDMEYKNNYDMFLANRETFDSKFLLIQAMHPEIESITLYTSTNLYPHGTTLKPLSELEEYEWYSQAISAQKPFFLCDNTLKQLKLVYLIPCHFYKNVMILSLPYDTAFADYKTLFEDDYALGIYDAGGELIFDYSSLSKDPGYHLFENSLQETMMLNVGEKFFRQSINKNVYGWTIVIYRPLEYVTGSANSFLPVILGMVLLCIGSSGFLGARLSRHLTQPLESLSHNMEQIQADNFVVTVQSNSNDEISNLIRTFGQMAGRLENTIAELYVNKLAKQEYRLQMLQSQINPHFLYNCLSMINGKAIRAEQPEISNIALQLSTFYRTTLNKGHNTTTIADEWRNTVSYIEIQKMLHSFSFEVTYDVDESLFPCKAITLIVQPLVENAILHGISHRDNTEDTVGEIHISLREVENCIKICVEDNGCGMDEKTLRNILTVETNGYGIRNVDQRIKLFFGNEYGIAYSSTLGVGTAAAITLPVIFT
ncbi:MAG: sensor histidine kinase [Acetatifactor sp.]|nr:sensor histidine kinase [Acetatifactor sp.]